MLEEVGNKREGCGVWVRAVECGRGLWSAAEGCGVWQRAVGYGRGLWSVVRGCGVWQRAVRRGRGLWTVIEGCGVTRACGCDCFAVPSGREIAPSIHLSVCDCCRGRGLGDEREGFREEGGGLKGLRLGSRCSASGFRFQGFERGAVRSLSYRLSKCAS